ncbi:hypothetical protein BLNAU_10713 [Blattamonas nauphoetae]|uniref:Symplekin/Pta1 N-terminal domain-containing protein n=1 Tax=Blattamonas nauphoetae TaxID=2049346 RepID=A0ABQ9XPM4_9EUKA|nr:hypothetical protein BLNAU_10713 [Blattamonas nauphoetae]
MFISTLTDTLNSSPDNDVDSFATSSTGCSSHLLQKSFATIAGMRAGPPTNALPFSTDCSLFLKWREGKHESEHERAAAFRSLVATVKLQPALDANLEMKAVKLLESVSPYSGEKAKAFLSSFAPILDESSIIITTAAMKMIEALIRNCSTKILLALVQAGLIPQLIVTLNPQSHSFAEAEDIHTCVITSIIRSFWLATPYGFKYHGTEDSHEEQATHEAILKQVLVPSGEYIRLVLTVTSCLTFFENDRSIQDCLYTMVNAQREWNKKRGEVRQLWKTMHRMLRMEGIEDVIEKKLQNNRRTSFGGDIVADSIEWNNLLTDPSSISHQLLPHHPHPPTPRCLFLIIHTLPLPSASPSPPTPSHSPLPLPHHPHPPTPLCLSLTTHTLPLASAAPNERTRHDYFLMISRQFLVTLTICGK